MTVIRFGRVCVYGESWMTVIRFGRVCVYGES